MIKSVYDMTGFELDYAVGKALGWVNYPTDSVEHGDTWHCEAEKAPFGRIVKLRDYRPSVNKGQALDLFIDSKFSAKRLGYSDGYSVGWCYNENGWNDSYHWVEGDSFQEAVCRCFLISKDFYEVEISEYVQGIYE